MNPPDPGHRVILLLGRDGQTGWELERCLAPLGRVVALGRAAVDLGDHAALRSVVREHRPAAIVNAHRFIFDSRDRGAAERLTVLNDKEGVWRCRTTFNCTDACPRGIKVTQAIQEVKRALLFRKA